MNTQTTTKGNLRVLRTEGHPAANFLEMAYGPNGLVINAWIAGADPTTREAHSPPDGQRLGIGAHLTADDAREVIRFLQAAIDEGVAR